MLLYRFLGVCPFLGVSRNAHPHWEWVWQLFSSSPFQHRSWLYTYILYPLRWFTCGRSFILGLLRSYDYRNVHQEDFAFHYRALESAFLIPPTARFWVLRLWLPIILYLPYRICLCFGFFNRIPLVIYLFSTLREKIERADVPKAFKGVPRPDGRDRAMIFRFGALNI